MSHFGICLQRRMRCISRRRTSTGRLHGTSLKSMLPGGQQQACLEAAHQFWEKICRPSRLFPDWRMHRGRWHCLHCSEQPNSSCSAAPQPLAQFRCSRPASCAHLSGKSLLGSMLFPGKRPCGRRPCPAPRACSQQRSALLSGLKATFVCIHRVSLVRQLCLAWADGSVGSV